ncbi:MAG: DUF4491 family protein [Anaerolineales bacterium]|nr:DUF4491 family protein [Anaerolineales bacterium]
MDTGLDRFYNGIGFEVASFFVSSLYLSAMCGILGVTLLWDSFEFYRQQKRIKHGHAPRKSKESAPRKNPG